MSLPFDQLENLEKESVKLEWSYDDRMFDQLTDWCKEFLKTNAAQPAYYGQNPVKLSPFSASPAKLDDIFTEYASVLKAGINPTSGSFFGYVPGGGIPSAAIGDFLAAITNRYSGVYMASPGAAEIHNQIIAWLISQFNLSADAWGTLTSGGSLANLSAIIAAREMINPSDWSRCVVYLSEECHHAAQKALHIAGMGHCKVSYVATSQYKICPNDLAEKIQIDLKSGALPWLVVSTLGTINTGAVDPIHLINKIAKQHNLWHHVDAAYGGFFGLVETPHEEFAELAHVDSFILDPHKGMFQPYGLGAVLVNNGSILQKSMKYDSPYLADVTGDQFQSPADYSLELTRHFRALRLWVTLKLHGIDRIRSALEEKLVLANYLHDSLANIKNIHTGPRPELSCVTFRTDCIEKTSKLLTSILDRGHVHVSSTNLDGKMFLRACILNFRSHKDNVDRLIDEIHNFLN